MLDLQAYLNRLASGEPTPGGGSAATIVGALGAALVAMVARITLASPKHAAVHGEAVLLVGDADGLRAQFVAARPLDEAAYGAVTHAQALPRGSDAERAERTRALQHALFGAAAAPLAVAELCGRLIDRCAAAAELGNAHLMSDVECALAFGSAALHACAANVRVNHRYLKDAAVVAEQGRALAAIISAANAREAAARDRIAAAI